MHNRSISAEVSVGDITVNASVKLSNPRRTATHGDHRSVDAAMPRNAFGPLAFTVLDSIRAPDRHGISVRVGEIRPAGYR
ncbi:MAG: hypothetical protein AMJ69_10860 [Gammaproteobacteria bacterium SG8_47]|nr:MAG: hypothetical protein AMJ69_10860 [Gammaproteobacteria bacterium SG8_47]